MKNRLSLENLKLELIRLLKSEKQDYSDLIIWITKLQSEDWRNNAYVYFVNPQNPNQPNSECNFKENIVLESEKFGTLILDILVNNIIGGVEFYNNLK